MTELWREDWAAIGVLRLGDQRVNRRIARVLAGLGEHPAGALTRVFSEPAEIKAAYRLLARADDWQEPLAQALRQGCLQRVAGCDFVLAIQDTTHLDFSASPANGDDGFWAHSLLAATPEGVPLGVLQQRFWQRDPATRGQRHQRRQRPLAAKESQRWLQALAAVGGDDWPAHTGVLVIGDRENDIFEYFAAPRPATCDLLVRAAQPRRVAGAAGNLWQAVAELPVADERVLTLPRRPERALRQARLQLRFGPVTLRPPKHGAAPAAAPVSLWVVAVAELAPPAGEAPLSWVLLTTRPLPTVAQAWQCVDFYCRRWLVERFHYTLKSGCGLEASQLRDPAALRGLTTLFSYVAWRLLWLTYLARTAPTAPATVAFTALECATLVRWQARQRSPAKAAPKPPPVELATTAAAEPATALPAAAKVLTLAEAVAALGRLGGHMGRRGDGWPGVKVLWRGLSRLQDIVCGVLLATHPNSQDVGNA
jgi:hypothetical protein